MDSSNFPFRLSLNASTLFPFQLDVRDQILVAANSGFSGIEVWVRDIESYVQAGGSLKELKQLADDAGIEVVNAIAFFKWADVDEEVRKAGLEQAGREIEMLAEIGCKAVAAPPFGDVAGGSLDEMGAQFTALAERSRAAGVEPYLEFWGRAPKLSRLSEAVYVAMASGLPDVKILLDPFHMYTGGSEVEMLRYLTGDHIGIVHVNDYPAEPARETITDADRVYPGDGVAPSSQFAKLLHTAGYSGYLSLELFIPDFGGKSPVEVASEGISKMKKAYAVN